MTAILLDFYGTLATAADPGDWFAEILADHGHDLDPEVRDRWSVLAWDGATHHEHSTDRATYESWEHTRWRGILRDQGILEGEHDELVAAVRTWREAFRMVPYEESATVLHTLRERGHRLVVCSNWDWDLDEHLTATGLADLVDARVSSAWIGSRKPHPLIYEEALSLAGVGPDEALFVGDTFDADVEGPRELGMTPVHVRRPADDRDHPPVPDDGYRIDDLTELPAIAELHAQTD